MKSNTCRLKPLRRECRASAASFFVGRVTIVAGSAQPATEFFHIPPGRVIELGGQVEM
jgi:K+ transporter